MVYEHSKQACHKTDFLRIFSLFVSTQAFWLHPADHMHLTGTYRTYADINAENGFDPFTGFHASQAVCTFCGRGQLMDDLQVFFPAGIGQVTTVPYPVESFWKDVKKEPAYEFFPAQKHRFCFAAIFYALVHKFSVAQLCPTL